MSIDEIISLMSYEEALEVIIPNGIFKDRSIKDIISKNPSALAWILSNGNKHPDNIPKAAAKVVMVKIRSEKEKEIKDKMNNDKAS